MGSPKQKSKVLDKYESTRTQIEISMEMPLVNNIRKLLKEYFSPKITQ